MTEAEVKNKANEKIIKELAQSYKRFAKTPDGKIILADLEQACGQMKSSCTVAGGFNPNETLFHEGMRNMYLYVINKIKREERN